MTNSDKFSIATRLYVQLRRKSNRAIDTVWMVQSNEYAREVLRVARAQADADLLQLANHFEMLMESGAAAMTPETDTSAEGRYVGRLR